MRSHIAQVLYWKNCHCNKQSRQWFLERGRNRSCPWSSSPHPGAHCR